MGTMTTKIDDDLRVDTRDFKYKLEHLHDMVKNDNPWKNEKELIKELTVDRKNKKN